MNPCEVKSSEDIFKYCSYTDCYKECRIQKFCNSISGHDSTGEIRFKQLSLEIRKIKLEKLLS